MLFAALNSFSTNRCCMSGSPPLMVNPPDMIFSPERYLRISSVASLNRHRHAVLHVPCIGVVAVETMKHTARGPSDETNARSIHRRSGSERMEEPHFAALERCSRIRIRHAPAQVYAQYDMGSSPPAGLAQQLGFSGIASAPVEGSIDHIQLLLAR